MPFTVQTDRGNTDRNTTNKGGDHFDRRLESFAGYTRWEIFRDVTRKNAKRG